ncbi:TIGR02680 family protein [Ectothiorhodospira mobilis]|uniref:TIGR02680 family protein n=1 Tax=Ectothiorhodospira mobilis TaxID=195064 RepID=UPI001EE9A2A0|nr:TIGR02680 family protein [Ectothiorhodospira mobilis]MCG5536013.1 TIGR02680 family protein [Ectothiorhodospira mobilis]
MTSLPIPAKDRWQPLRIGLVDLFHYDHEEFRFHDGRLLLRGNNGTGKSKVMALTLPFLLDGRVTPSRVEPDGDPNKRMEWNLLMGEAGERLGYTWIEFGRLREGSPEYRTLGCGLKAVAQKRLQSWFFITPQRVGEDLFLVEDGRTLTRDRLLHALGERGQLHDQSGQYRRAVDEQLFHLGTGRYEALLDLLLQLRQPQLSKRPDESRLSMALTRALPPLDADIVADVAEAYRNLDAEADETRGLEEAHQAVTEFLRHYRQYAAIATRRRAAGVRTAHSRYEEIRATLGRQRKELTEARAQEETQEQRREQLEEERQALEQQRQTLRDSPAMRSARDLQQAEDDARQRREHADSREAYRKRSEQRQIDLEQRQERQAGRAETAEKELRQLLDDMAQNASQAGFQDLHTQEVQHLEETGAAATLPERLRSHLNRRLEAVQLLTTHNQALDEAERQVVWARQYWQQQQEDRDRLDREMQAARQRTESAAKDLLARWRDHLYGLGELQLNDPEALLARLEDWMEHMQGPHPAEAALEERRSLQLNRIAAEVADRHSRQQILEEQLGLLQEEREALQGGREIAPPAPHTRDVASREGRAGGPLWQLVDFRDPVPDPERAGLEAALEAAGLLDGWVMPGGEILDPDTHDTLLTPEAPIPHRHLGSVLLPAMEDSRDAHPPVSPEVVHGILARIGLGPEAPEGPAPACRVSESGHWQLGPARGAWSKPASRYIGHAAREAARRARLAEIDAEFQACRDALEDITRALEALEARRHRIHAEWRDRPDDTPLREAHAREASALKALEDQEERTETARKALEQRRQEEAQCRQQRDEVAADLSLPTSEEALSTIRQALADYTRQCDRLPSALQTRQREREHLQELQEEREEARRETLQATEQAHEALRQARDAETHRDTLRETVGADVEALQQRLTEVDARSREIESEQQRLRQEVNRILRQIGGLEKDIDHGEQRRHEMGAQREEAIGALRTLAGASMIPLATGDRVSVEERASWAPEAAVQLSRRLEQTLSDVDDGEGAWQRHQKGLHQHFVTLQAALGRHGHDAHAEQQGDLLLVGIVFQGRHQGPDRLAGELEQEIQRRRELLTARERELVENYLIDEVASHIQMRLMETERQVQHINEELAQRPTSTGMRLRLRWHPLAEGETQAGLATPAGLEVTRERLLRQNMDAWSAEDRRAVGEFIQARIREARESEEGGALQDILERALDYRYWHRFTVERWQNGRWRPAYGPASGGERALVITLPLFAAAASHYGSAHPSAPRMIMLDEVFAGVDDDARAKSMGLLAQFDLDALMTSEREWGCYPDVHGLAIAQLNRREGLDAVYVIHWRWDGRHRIREAAPDTPLEAGTAPTTDDPEPTENGQLF